MARVLVIPDMNLNVMRLDELLALRKKYRISKTVILGNYFAPPVGKKVGDLIEYKDMWEYLQNIIRNDNSIIPLIGEHELNYLPGYNPVCKRNEEFAKWLGYKLINDYRFMPVVAVDGVLYSHAGVSENWLRRNKIMYENELRYRLGQLAGAALIEDAVCYKSKWEHYGDSNSCARAKISEIISYAPRNVRQVIGHTYVSDVCNAGKIFMANTLSDEIIIVADGEPQFIKLEREGDYEV